MEALNEFLSKGVSNLAELDKLVKLARSEEDERRKRLLEERKETKARKKQKKSWDLQIKKKNLPIVVTRQTIRKALIGEIPLNKNIQKGMHDTLGLLKCLRCDLVKPREHFNGSFSVCHPCKLAKVGTKCPVEAFCYKIFYEIKQRCKQKDFACSITPEWIKNRYESTNGCCELCGDEVTVERTFLKDKGERTSVFQYPYNLSVDRIDSDRGYMSDNCQIVHVRCNLMKNDQCLSDFLLLCEKISIYNRSTIF